jgi:hypothetical protein
VNLLPGDTCSYQIEMNNGLPVFWMNTTLGFDIEWVDYMYNFIRGRFLQTATPRAPTNTYSALNRLTRDTKPTRRIVTTQIVNGTIKYFGSDARALGIMSGRY